MQELAPALLEAARELSVALAPHPLRPQETAAHRAICSLTAVCEPRGSRPAELPRSLLAGLGQVNTHFPSRCRHCRCDTSHGDYPIVDYLDAALRSGYRAPISLELFNDGFRGASGIAVGGMLSLLAARRELAAHAGRPRRIAAAAAGQRPDIPRVRGVRQACAGPGRVARRPRLKIDRPPSHESGRPLCARRTPFRHQPRKAVVRARVPVSARGLGVRDDARGRQRRARLGAGARTATSAACWPHRPGRSADPGDRRRRGEPDLFR